MKKILVVALFLTVGCALNSGTEEEVLAGRACENPRISVTLNNLLGAVDASTLDVRVFDAKNRQIAMKKDTFTSDYATFVGVGTAGQTYTAFITENGNSTSRHFNVGFASAYCDYNASYDYPRGEAVTAI